MLSATVSMNHIRHFLPYLGQLLLMIYENNRCHIRGVRVISIAELSAQHRYYLRRLQAWTEIIKSQTEQQGWNTLKLIHVSTKLATTAND